MPMLNFSRFAFIVLCAVLLAACGAAAPTVPPEPSATPTPAGPQTLTICTATEPASLYLYADNSAAARLVRQAIYDGPFDTQDFLPQAVILQSVPSLDNDGAQLQPVSVGRGALVVDADGQISELEPGLRIRPAGCRDGNCVVEYSEGEVQMDQLQVHFALIPGLTWADGIPLTAADSVYSFQLQADSATPGDKALIARTASYTAEGDQAVWVGLPGYLDPGYQTHFWTPLPQHAWGGQTAADLLASEAANRQPLGWGAYAIREWQAGQRIVLERNPNYARAAQGLPYFSTLTIQFGQFGAADLQSGACDLLLPSDGLAGEQAALQAAGAQLHYVPSGRWEQLSFGIREVSHDDGFDVFRDQPDWFGDQRMREAVALCLDRQALVDRLAFGQGAVLHSYPPAGAGVSYGIAYDPAAGNALLEELGWLAGPDGVRSNQFFPGAPFGTALQLTLHTSDTLAAAEIAEILRSSLDDCGISLQVQAAPAAEVFAPGPNGPVFGRRFQFAQFAWPVSARPACYLYLGEAIPGQDVSTYRYSWGGWNVTGFDDESYDASCQAALTSLPGEANFAELQSVAQNALAQQLPALPLFEPYQLAAARADFCGFASPAGSQLLQAIESYGYAEWCQ